MSVRALTWAFDVKVKNPRAKLVLLALADSANADTDQCWPSVTFVAKKCEMGRATAYRAIAYLEYHKLLKHEQRRHANGGSRSPLFTLLIGVGVSQSDTPGVSDNETRGVPAVRRQEEPKLEPKDKKDSNGNGIGKVGKGKPKHRQKSKQGRVWLDLGTDEFKAYYDDYHNTHHVYPKLLWGQSGAWFNLNGEMTDAHP